MSGKGILKMPLAAAKIRRSKRQSKKIFVVCYRLLGEAETIDFEDYVTADNQNTMREHLVDNQYNIQGKIDVSGHKYFPSEMLMNFIDVAVDRIGSQLEEFECYA